MPNVRSDGAPGLRAALELEEALTRAVVAGGGLPGIADVLHRHVRLPVGIWNGHGRVLASAPEAACAAVPDGETWWCYEEHDGMQPVWVGVHHAGHELHRNDPERERIQAALGQAARAAAVEQLRLRSVADVELKVWGDLTTAILDGEDPDRVSTLASSLGYDLGEQRRVIVVRPEAPGGDVERLRFDVRALDDHAMMTTRDDHPVLIVKDDVDWHALHRALETTDDSVRLGASSPRQSAHGLARALREAQLALRVSEALGGPRLTYFDDLGLYRLLAHAEPEELQRHVERWLGPVIEHDRERDAELVRTLTEYLERGCSVEQTARALFIHRSTLKYRLQRIADLLDCNLGDADTRFNLHVATRALLTMRAIKSSDGDSPNGDRPR